MKFLHLSDLHYSPSTDGWSSRELREELPKYLTDNNIQIDELFITGDFRHAKLQKNERNKDAAQKAIEYIWEIARVVGITESKNIHIVPGNHDRKRLKKGQEKLKERMQMIKRSYTSESGFLSRKDLDFIRKQFHFFGDICNGLYGEDNIWKSFELHGYHVVQDHVVLYMNTSIMHNEGSDRGNLIVGTDCLERTLKTIKREYPDLPIIVLAHHSPDYFAKQEQEAVRAIFRKYPISLYLCGDSHKVWWKSINGYIEITMGCLKNEAGTDVAVLYGDTDESSFIAYHWHGTWEPYNYFNQEIKNHYAFLSHEEDRANAMSGLETDVASQVEAVSREPIIACVSDKLSYKLMIERLYEEQRFKMKKHVETIVGVSTLYEKFFDKKIVLTGLAGQGKSTALKYLFLNKFNDVNHPVYYTTAHIFRSKKNELNNIDKYIRSIVEDKSSTCSCTIFIDALDEAFADSHYFASQLLYKIEQCKAAIWVGCRSDYFSLLDCNSYRSFNEIGEIMPWEYEDAMRYVERYAGLENNSQLAEKVQHILRDREKPWYRPLLITMLLFVMEEDDTHSLYNEYDLLDRFVFLWFKREESRGTSNIRYEAFLEYMYDIAINVYERQKLALEVEDSAVKGLLVTENKGRVLIKGFYHRNLCIYFIVKQIIETIKMGDLPLIKFLARAFLNDVTSFAQEAFEGLPWVDMERMYFNLFNTYKQIYEPESCYLSEDAREYIKKMDACHLLKLKDEIIYFITRLPNIDPQDFFEYAVQRVDDPIIRLGLAYGLGLKQYHTYAMEFVRQLVPGSQEELLNRSWTVAFFEDVNASVYTYRDIYQCKWTISRTVRLERLKKDTDRAYRHRLFDIPLLYCFYTNRNWRNCVSEEDFEIIKTCDIDWDKYTDEEKTFLQEQKQKLVSAYEKVLRQKVIC